MERSTVLRCLLSSTSNRGGRPPARPRRSRCPTWSEGCGMIARMPRWRKRTRSGVPVVLGTGMTVFGLNSTDPVEMHRLPPGEQLIDGHENTVPRPFGVRRADGGTRIGLSRGDGPVVEDLFVWERGRTLAPEPPDQPGHVSGPVRVRQGTNPQVSQLIPPSTAVPFPGVRRRQATGQGFHLFIVAGECTVGLRYSADPGRLPLGPGPRPCSAGRAGQFLIGPCPTMSAENSDGWAVRHGAVLTRGLALVCGG